MDLLREVDCILLLLFVEFYELPLQSLPDLHLSDGLLVACPYLYALRVVHSLREGAGPVGRVFRAARHVEIGVIIEAVPAFSTLWICCLLFFW